MAHLRTMRKKKYYIFAVPVIIILLLLGMLLYSPIVKPTKSWHCSPTEPRGDDLEAWQKTITPAQQPQQLDEDFFDKFIVGSDADYFTVEHPSENPPDNPFAFEPKELTPGEPLEIGGGILGFSCIGTAYHDANQTLNEDATYQFFDEDFQNMSETRIKELGIYNITEHSTNFRYSPYPAVQFIFEHQGIDDVKFHSIKVFDSRTRNQFGGGGNASGSPGSYRFQTHVSLWHHAPIDAVIDVSFGPSKTFEFAPRMGEGFDEGNFKCRLLGVFEGVEPSRHSSSSSSNTMIHKLPKASPDEAGLCFFFACQPTASQMPVTFEFLDKDGNKINTRGSSTSGAVHDIRLRQSLDQIAIIRARYRTRRYRIVVHLPFIPGLPEQNEKIDNLFDVYIPYARLHDAGQVGAFLQRTLQLGRSRGTGPTPKTSINNYQFPLDFNDVTIREIARYYAKGGTLHIDLENNQLNREYPIPLSIRIERFLQKIFP